MSKVELPEGLEHYEFVRELTPSKDVDNLYHFVPVLEEGCYTPKMTINNEPDKQSWSWGEFFTNGNPVELEIGSGKGGFTVEYAQKMPEINILGSEWDGTWAKYSGERINKANLSNAKMLKGDILYFLRDRVPDNSITAFHMYFPDPWPKKRHHKNRLMLKPEFMENIRRTSLESGSVFYWGTDHKEYNELAQELFENTPYIEILEPNAEPTQGIMTNFEKKYRKEGRPIYRTILKINK